MTDITDKIETDKECALALGYFDGFHLGHRAIAQAAVNTGFRAVAVTFKFGASRLAAKGGGDLTTSAQKRAFFEKAGFYGYLESDFDEIRALTARQYFERYIAALNPRVAVCGEDYRFGCDLAGVDELAVLCGAVGARTVVLPRVSLDGELSSTAIKACLADGDIQGAVSKLGHPYSIQREVVAGDKRGRTLGFPTVNQSLSGLFVPRRGVYASTATVRGETKKSVTNIGVRPTFSGGGEAIAETHIFDFSADVYGEVAEVVLTRFLRDEQRFSSGSELAEAVKRDMLAARQ